MITGRDPPWPHGLAVAVLFAIAGGAICARAQYVAHALGGDHLMLWRAAHIVLDGGDPYALMFGPRHPRLFILSVSSPIAAALGIVAWTGPAGAQYFVEGVVAPGESAPITRRKS